MTFDNGSEADLQEKPHNLIEITPGGPFLMRILHQKQVDIAEIFYSTLINHVL